MLNVVNRRVRKSNAKGIPLGGLLPNANPKDSPKESFGPLEGHPPPKESPRESRGPSDKGVPGTFGVGEESSQRDAFGIGQLKTQNSKLLTL